MGKENNNTLMQSQRFFFQIIWNNINLLHAGEGNMKIYFTQEYHIPWGQHPMGIWYWWGNHFSYFLLPYNINVLLYRMKPRKHIHVKYYWKTYFKSIGTLSQTFKNHIHNNIKRFKINIQEKTKCYSPAGE